MPTHFFTLRPTTSFSSATSLVEIVYGSLSCPPSVDGHDSKRLIVLNYVLREKLTLLLRQVILHVYVEDEQRLRCAVSGGVQALVDTIRTKAPQMQVSTACSDRMAGRGRSGQKC